MEAQEEQQLISMLKAIPAEFHHNDYATRAIAVAIKRIQEKQHANVRTDSNE